MEEVTDETKPGAGYLARYWMSNAHHSRRLQPLGRIMLIVITSTEN